MVAEEKLSEAHTKDVAVYGVNLCDRPFRSGLFDDLVDDLALGRDIRKELPHERNVLIARGKFGFVALQNLRYILFRAILKIPFEEGLEND